MEKSNGIDMEINERIKELSAESKIGALRAIYASDFRLFRKNLVYTLDEHDTTGNPIKKFPTWSYLDELDDDILRYHWLFILKSRQMMATWELVAYLLWTILFHKGKKVAFQSKKGDDADALVQRAKVIYDHLPKWKPQAEFSYSRIRVPEMYSDGYGIPQGPDQLRSYTFSVIFSDEFGFQEELQDTFSASKPAVDGGGQFIAVTTWPKGRANFRKNWLKNPVFEAPKGKLVKLHYSRRPDKDDLWKREARKGYTEEAWNREQEMIELEGGKKRIFDPFSELRHVNSGLIYQKEKPILRSFDFGFHRPACSWSQIDDQDRWNDLYEILGCDEILENFAPRVIAEGNMRFSDASFIDYCDYAGEQKSDKNRKTSVQILVDFTKQYPISRPNLDIEDGHEMIRKKMVMWIGDRPGYQIHPSCVNSIDGFLSGYVYGRDGKTPIGDLKDEDEKENNEKDYFKHLQDCRRYKFQNIYTNKGDRMNTGTKLNARQPNSYNPANIRMNARRGM